MSRELTPQETAERSLIKTYRKSIWNPFIAAVKRYELIEPGDRIAVCISGGKDSVILAKLMQELQRHTSQPFELVFMVMDPGYKPENRKLIEDNAALLGIPITIFDSDIFDVTVSVEKNPCYLCARMRRGFLYAKAQELGCNKIALGHHQDDILHTALMNQMFQGHFSTMPARLTMRKMPITIIRPLCMEEEADIRRYAETNGYEKQKKLCPYETDSHRSTVAHLFEEMERIAPEARFSMWNALKAEGKLVE